MELLAQQGGHNAPLEHEPIERALVVQHQVVDRTTGLSCPADLIELAGTVVRKSYLQIKAFDGITVKCRRAHSALPCFKTPSSLLLNLDFHIDDALLRLVISIQSFSFKHCGFRCSFFHGIVRQSRHLA